ncbi:hypothetical protein Pure05_35150 [Paenarthrobacter ureafaciens]|nr:hypothetical protein Pure01_35170 [Paenarthrobacter ureafaciens]GLU65274.1 hypothetical protein Pure02_35240 [Paenarthrobacter ureafaciens]GLU69576.1 hypothetical protein Pure03_35520 [Paenarthrobacter ureafaciens]GLU73834.1 hypothetical protein Pure04_35490 [Paenarthrobacter ureafaciens]GLU78075.1 hypothetical protein Pure05_35150 [Paenarthrobacter ureafaciens]
MPTSATVAGEAALSKLLDRTEVLGMTGINCWGKPSTSAPTVAVALGAGAGAVLLPEGVAVAEALPAEGDAETGALDDVPEEGAAEPPDGWVQAEAVMATPTASRASPRVRGVPESFTGMSFLGVTPGLGVG